MHVGHCPNGQQISKQNCRTITSPKKQMNKFVFLSWWLWNTWNLNFDFKFQVFPSGQDRKTYSSVCFLGEFTAQQFCFQDLLTRSDLIMLTWIISDFFRDHIYILRNHIFRIFGPPSPLRNHVFGTDNNQKLAFSDPPSPPTSDYVTYEWSLSAIFGLTT